MRALLFAALLLSTSLSGCLFGIGRDPMLIAVSAPKASSAMTLFLVTDATSLDRFRDQGAEYSIYFGDKLIYPSGGHGASFEMDGRSGTAVVPYNFFVVGNGDYDILVRYAGETTRARVRIEKWVDYVWLHPFDQDDVISVETALSSATGGRPENRILTRGELILTIRYHGESGREDRFVGQITTETRNDRAATITSVPRSRLNQGTGYYSFEPLFHNLEARDNLQVGPDPTMANLKPAWNWIHVAS